jgi:hypothetical protein
MKKTFILLALSLLLGSTFATAPIAPPLNASTIMLPVGKNGEKMSLHELAYIKPREFAKVSGRHMNFFDRAGFTIAQKKLRNSIRPDGTIDNKKMDKIAAAMAGDTGFHLGGFALGFLLGLIGVLIAYLIKDDYKPNRVKWAWIGFGVGLVLYLIIVLAA